MNEVSTPTITKARLQELRGEFAARVGRLKEQGLVYMGYTTIDPLSTPDDPILNSNTVNIHDMDSVLAEDTSATIVTLEEQASIDQEYSTLAVMNNLLRLREEGKLKPYNEAFDDSLPNYDTTKAVIAPPEPI